MVPGLFLARSDSTFLTADRGNSFVGEIAAGSGRFGLQDHTGIKELIRKLAVAGAASLEYFFVWILGYATAARMAL